MTGVLDESGEMGVLNESTAKIHKYAPERSRGEAQCGATITATHDRLRVLPLGQALDRDGTTKCGRCFGDGGGY